MSPVGRRTPTEATILAVLLVLSCAGCGRKASVSPPVAAQPQPQAPPERPVALPPVEPKPAPAPVVRTEVNRPAPIPEPDDGGPPIRIGLTTAATEVTVTAPGDFFLVEKIPEAPRRALRGEYLVSVERPPSAAADIYRLQVASLSNAEAAERLRRELAEKLSQPVVTRQNPETGTTQVRLGEFTTREEAQSYGRGPLTEAGYTGSIVVRDTTDRAGGEARIALRGPDRFFRLSRNGFFFFPASRSEFLRLDGKPYRGVLDLSLNRSSRLTVVNQVGVEDYLLGVVPAEISPTTYPETAALSAQAVAARTYALKNAGRFAAEGFDLTADVRSQVYGGVSHERELTNHAVRSTRGLALYFQGELINAMYSSTCGGRTEDFSNVFDAAPVPYLTSVYCTTELSHSEAEGPALQGRHSLEDAVMADDGTVANRNLELAEVLGIAGPGILSNARLSESPAPEEVQVWLRRARELAGVESSRDPKPTTFHTSRAGFLEYAALSFFGSEQIQRRISSSDANYYLGNLRDGRSVPASAAPSIAFLMQKGLWRPYPDNSARPSEPMRRMDALSLLARWVEASRNNLLRTATFAGFIPEGAGHSTTPSRISVKQGNATRELLVSPDLRLFRVADGRSLPADKLRVIGNERLSFRLGPDGQIVFLEVELNPAGAASDRYSPQSSWQTELTRQVVSEKLRSLAPALGEVLDLEPVRLGNSGRAVRIRVTGRRGSVELNGYRVRNALGLRDTLFTITRTHNLEAAVDKFIFNGRGWGHGVGLCQVGAFGMARSGVRYEDILKSYYQGIEIRKAFQ